MHKVGQEQREPRGLLLDWDFWIHHQLWLWTLLSPFLLTSLEEGVTPPKRQQKLNSMYFLSYGAPPPGIRFQEEKDVEGQVGRAGMNVMLAPGPTRDFTVGAGAALAAVSCTAAGPREQLLTVPASTLASIFSTRTPLRPG